MTAITNFVRPSFFDDIPLKAVPAACAAWDGISESRTLSIDGFYISFCQKLQVRDVAPPPRHEFVEWFRKIRAGTAPRPLDGPDLPAAVALFPKGGDPVDRALKAYAIVTKAVQLQQAMIDGGYSPDSVEMEDQIVAEAIKDWLAYEASAEAEESGCDTQPVELAFGMLRPSEPGCAGKLLDVLATHMQRELACAIVNVKAQGGAA